jgi:hypothetical protein
MQARFRRAFAVGLPLMGVLCASCYGTNIDPCYYHYGYYYEFCDYEYLESFTPNYGYDPVVTQQLEPQQTPHPDPSLASKLSDDSVSLRAYLYVRRTTDTGDTPADEILDGEYPCGLGDDRFTLCGAPTLRARDTDYIIVAGQAQSDVPVTDDVNFLVIGWGFDRDGDPSNNYAPPDARLNDYFGQTDQWYAAAYVPGGDIEDSWTLRAFRLDAMGQPIEFETEGRVILQEDTAVLIVPADEFLVETPRNRISLFRHTGDEGEGPDRNWSGFVWPPLGAPLAGL